MGKDDPTVVIPVGFCTCLLIIGLLCYIVFTFFDAKLDKELGDARDAAEPAEEEFKLSDVGKIFGSKLFWIVAMLCVLYYSAIFPFQRYAANMLQCTLHISATTAADIFRWFPMGAMVLTPLLGYYLDRKGKGASMLILGAILMIVCHLTFALLLPYSPAKLSRFRQSSFSVFHSRWFRPHYGPPFPRLWKPVFLEARIR